MFVHLYYNVSKDIGRGISSVWLEQTSVLRYPQIARNLVVPLVRFQDSSQKKQKHMKYLIILFAIALASCGKPSQPLISASGDNVAFYKITEVDINGKSFTTPVKRISLTSNFGKNGGNHNDDDHDDHEGNDQDDDDDDHGGCDTTVLPIKISSFLVTLNDPSTILITWESQNEDNTSHYIVEKSMDTKSWAIIAQREKSFGFYSVKDVISK